MKADHYFWKELKNHKPFLTKQQYRTIKGQAKAGQIDTAQKGLQLILSKRGN